MYHVPRGRAWNPTSLVEALRKRGALAWVRDSHVVVRLPFFDRAQDLRELTAHLEEYENREWVFEPLPKPILVGVTDATLEYRAQAVIENLVFKFPGKSGIDLLPMADAVERAVIDCGYYSGTEREIIKLYFPNDSRIDELLDSIDRLQSEKEQAVMDQRFEDAFHLRNQQHAFRCQIEDLLQQIK